MTSYFSLHYEDVVHRTGNESSQVYQQEVSRWYGNEFSSLIEKKIIAFTGRITNQILHVWVKQLSWQAICVTKNHLYRRLTSAIDLADTIKQFDSNTFVLMKETSTFQLDKGTGGGRSFGFFSKDPEQAKQDKRERVDSNIEEVSE